MTLNQSRDSANSGPTNSESVAKYRSPYRAWISLFSILTVIGIAIGMSLLTSHNQPILMVSVWGLVIFLLLGIITLCCLDIVYIRWKVASLEEKKSLEQFLREAKNKPREEEEGS